MVQVWMCGGMVAPQLEDLTGQNGIVGTQQTTCTPQQAVLGHREVPGWAKYVGELHGVGHPPKLHVHMTVRRRKIFKEGLRAWWTREAVARGTPQDGHMEPHTPPPHICQDLLSNTLCPQS